ncbi:MAG: hypothetical protein ABR902_19550 [Candidatus Korobacteraceae bacterium]|jgi:hypothetical protein
MLLLSSGEFLTTGGITSKQNFPPAASDIGFGVGRYNSTGTADTTFGKGGISVADFGSNAPYAAASALVLQSNGDIVAGGLASSQPSSAPSFGLARFTS